MIVKRLPLEEEPMNGHETSARYDRYARRFMFPEYRYFVRKILRHGIRSGKVLDIGTGSGWLALELSRTRDCRFEIVGLDMSEDMLQNALNNVRQAGMSDRISLVRGTAAQMPFPDRSFDLVVSYASLHHWSQPVAVFNEIERVVRDSGTVIIRDNLRVYGDFWRETLVRTIRLFMNKSQRALWPRSILASYTLPEVVSLLNESRLKGCQVATDFVKLDICVFRGPQKKYTEETHDEYFQNKN